MIIDALDNFLNKLTMYRLVLYSLIALILLGLLFSVTGNVAISTSGLILTTAVLVVICYVSNRAMSYAFKVSTNNESWLITALILALILQPQTRPVKLVEVGLGAVIAMASKFILVKNRSPIFNPAAIAALVLSFAGFIPATWWVGSPAMASLSVVVALALLRKQRKFSLFVSFTIASVIIYLISSYYSGGQLSLLSIKTLLLSYPLIFLGSVMLTEPSTLPVTRYFQVLYAIIVGFIFAAQQHFGRISTTPELALIIGNIFTALIAYRFASRIRLIERFKLADNIYELVFEKPQSLNFIAGQYMQWTFSHPKSDNRGNRRSFSIASSPTEKDLRVIYKTYEKSSTYKTRLGSLQPGQFVDIAQPAGEFTLPTDVSKKLIFVAGGIGITPFRSMIKYLIDQGQERQIDLFYIAKPSEQVCKELFKAAEKIGIRVNYIDGKIDNNVLKQVLDGDEDKIIYISGPNGLVKYYKRQFLNLGLKRSSIKTDYFSGY
ncbi:MAG TPA: FAD-binding oxidoreductase [Candidatus Saccharimonadales bacterium]|nr:FAD-binding oxidoreductase [Candidatus Saccharimonadales bacterium]